LRPNFQPSTPAFSAASRAAAITSAGRPASSDSTVTMGVGVGGVEDVLGELGAEAGHFFLDGLEAGLLVVGQLGAGEAEAAQLVVDDPLAGRAEAGEGGAVAD
jgi:hypothetical protein